jgi:hypothetical protein
MPPPTSRRRMKRLQCSPGGVAPTKFRSVSPLAPARCRMAQRINSQSHHHSAFAPNSPDFLRKRVQMFRWKSSTAR